VLAAHWGRILDLPVSGKTELRPPNCVFRFVKGESEIMSALTFKVADIEKVRDAARKKGLDVAGEEFALGGVMFRLTA
jgi:hypothetical protein